MYAGQYNFTMINIIASLCNSSVGPVGKISSVQEHVQQIVHLFVDIHPVDQPEKKLNLKTIFSNNILAC